MFPVFWHKIKTKIYIKILRHRSLHIHVLYICLVSEALVVIEISMSKKKVKK